MKLYFEWGTRQLNKRGEELCGDSIVVSRRSDSVTLALSDGLGSGVKANILATLTTRIAMHMLENGLSLTDVVETLGQTLPVCEVRKLAYSTFSIARFFSEGHARIVEFDTPSAIHLRNRKHIPVPGDERKISGKTIHESLVPLQLGDWMVFVSDGVLNAGIGGLYPLGWGWDEAARFLENHTHPDISAQELAEKTAEAVAELYADAPGDDVSIVVIKVRQKLVATVFAGPPIDKRMDGRLVRRFLERPGLHIICGGTTARIVSRHAGSPLEVDLETMRADVPALARMECADLVTEGILTLTRVKDMLCEGARRETVQFQADGAAVLVRTLLSVDYVHFIIGLAVNPAHQNPNLPVELGIKLAVVREIAEELKRRGIETSIEPL